MAIKPVALKSQVDFLPDQLSSRYMAVLDYTTFLEMGERVIWDRIIQDASQKLATAFIEKYGQQIIESVSYQDVSQKVVEEVVKRMIDTLKK